MAGYPFDYQKDLQHIRSLAIDFPAINLQAELTVALGGRVVDRMLELNSVIKVTATSYRRKRARQRMGKEGH